MACSVLSRGEGSLSYTLVLTPMTHQGQIHGQRVLLMPPHTGLASLCEKWRGMAIHQLKFWSRVKTSLASHTLPHENTDVVYCAYSIPFQQIRVTLGLSPHPRDTWRMEQNAVCIVTRPLCICVRGVPSDTKVKTTYRVIKAQNRFLALIAVSVQSVWEWPVAGDW